MGDTPRWETLKRSISDATEALAALELRRREIELLLRAQEGELASLVAASTIAPRITVLPTIEPPRTTSAKIALFRQLFRGRPPTPSRWFENPGAHDPHPGFTERIPYGYSHSGVRVPLGYLS